MTAPEVPGCGLRVAEDGRGLCEVSTEPTPHSKQLGPAWVPAPSSRLAADGWLRMQGHLEASLQVVADTGPPWIPAREENQLACWEPGLALPFPAPSQQ